SQRLPTADTIAPAFAGIDWDDADGSGSLSLGDRYVFRFGEAMRASAVRDQTQDANALLRPVGGPRYGSVNTVAWAPDGRSVAVTVTPGFTILGDEVIIPSPFVTDVAGNPVTGTQQLTGIDRFPPTLAAVFYDDADGSGTVTAGDRYTFRFNEPMRASGLSDNTVEANLNLSPAGRKYGDVNRISWNAGLTEARVEITAGFTVTGGEVVTPSPLLTDKAGNPVSNTGTLTLTDTVAPAVVKVQANYVSPVSAVANYRLTVQFDSAMDGAAPPAVQLASTGGASPVVPGGGTWLTTRYPGDTYTTPPIALAQGMDGTLTAGVSGARDRAGNAMAPAPGVFTAVLDATPPPNPAVTVASTTCSSATLTWSGYGAPADLAGFQLYRSTAGEFSAVDGRSFAELAAPAARSAVVGSLALDTTYHLAVAAMDKVGNVNPAVTSHRVRIDQVVPPPVAAALRLGANPDVAVLAWPGYAAADLCGLAGFRVYRQEAGFTDVTGLTPVATLGTGAREYTATGLDRARTYFFAVVGVNGAGGLTPAVTALRWSDPYAGVVTADTTIGGGDLKVVEIASSITVRGGATLTVAPGATLRFAPGAGISVEDGALVAEGTPFAPVVFTSPQDRPGGTPQPGDWPGITLGSGASGSRLRHVFVKYGAAGLALDGVAPTVEAFSALYNQGAGLLVRNGATLVTSAALLRWNGVGARAETGGDLQLTGSVLKQNTVNASSDGSRTVAAGGNWWGAVDAPGVAATVTAGVDTAGFLTYEPVLSPALATADGATRVGNRAVSLVLASRNAEEQRLAEDSTFPGVFYGPFSPAATFTLSPEGGEKTVFAQFRSPTGAESAPVPLALTYVTEGPAVSAFSLTEGQVISRPLGVTAAATAALGLAALEFRVDGALVAEAAASPLTLRWDPRALTNGIHRVRFVARDRAGNTASAERNVVVSLTPPPAPVLTAPADGALLTVSTATVRGTAEPLVPVRVTRNGTVVGTPTAGANGAFEVAGVSLVEGDNLLLATAQDSVGVSAQSNRVTVGVDSGAPAAPVLVSATAVAGRGVDLLWRYADVGERPTRFRVYRSPAPFAAPAQATLVADNRTALDHTDRTPTDGTYHYAVAGLDAAGNLSALSNLIAATYDGTPPSFAVQYAPAPPAGVGDLAITLTASEGLAAPPTLTVRPAGSPSPLTVALTLAGDRTYTGTLAVGTGTASGTAAVSVSGRDAAGNSFSGAPSGPALVLDTRGPRGALALDRVPPVQVTSPVSLGLTLTLDEAAKPFTVPQLTFTPPEGAAVAVALVGAGASWTGTLPLAPAMGKGFGSFALAVEDA
ncbi:MAG: Ig-like domain-containing protein, partial [Deferrisomatales bacterium]